MSIAVKEESQTPNQPRSHSQSPSEAMLRMISGFWICQAISVTAKLGIADLVADRPLTAAELAKVTDTDSNALYRVLRGLASVGIFVEDDQQRFTLTPLATTLQTDVPGSLRYLAIMRGESVHYQPWGAILYSVKTGKRASEHVFGESIFEHVAKDPEFLEIFHHAMDDITRMTARAIPGAYDLSRFKKIVDVGGGQGTLLTILLNENRISKGVLFDEPHVVKNAEKRLEAAGVADRCEITPGSFFDSIPSGGDLYVLKSIILDWDDQQAISILKNCHRAMAPGSRLLVIEPIVPPKNEPGFGKLLDLNMLVMTGGKNRTEQEHRSLLREADFQHVRIIPTPSPLSLIEAQLG
jgi:tRNA A58 N-methylase Trm61